MTKALVIYYSRGGNTKKMAESIVKGIKKEDIDVVKKAVSPLQQGISRALPCPDIKC